ncbi:MAG: hypothetical protein GX766_00465 [Firmicutes bacterium]|nr:hypothetical protein [Bacillota bacterium]
MPTFSPEDCHKVWLEKSSPSLAYKQGEDFANWQLKAKAKLAELLGDRPQPVPLNEFKTAHSPPNTEYGWG